MPFWGAMSNSLTEVDAKGNITADLVESMEPVNSDWRFKLLKGVTFHNGKSFTAEDVIASYRYHIGPEFQIRGQIPAAGSDRHQGRWA